MSELSVQLKAVSSHWINDRPFGKLTLRRCVICKGHQLMPQLALVNSISIFNLSMHIRVKRDVSFRSTQWQAMFGRRDRGYISTVPLPLPIVCISHFFTQKLKNHKSSAPQVIPSFKMNTGLYSFIMRSMEDRLNNLSLNTTLNVSAGQSTLTVATSDNDINPYIDHPVSLESLYDQLNILRSGPTTNPDATIGRSTSHTGPIANSAMNTASSLTCIVQSLHRELDVLSLGPATDDGTNGQSTSHAAPANGGMLDIGSMGLHTSRNDITSASQARALRAERQAQLSKLRKQMDEVADRMENLSMVKAVPAAVPTLRDIERSRGQRR